MTAADEETISADDDLSVQETVSAEETRQEHPLTPGLGAEAANRVGRFVVLGRLGQGAMGVVLAAWDPQLERRVAVKLLLPEIDEDPDRRERRRLRMLREAQALAKLSHPNVVSVHDAGTLDDRVFVAMEFIEGETLRKKVAATDDPAVLMNLFLQAGRGLAAAHAAGLVHRDFKPDNVLVGDDGRVRVVDFGLARGQARGPAEAEAELPAGYDSKGLLSSEMTRKGAIMGTPAYLPPEGLFGAEVGPAGDQFSFCVTMWEAFFGERPFEGSSLGALVHAMESGAPTSGRPRVPIRPHVRRTLARGLSVEPEQRWPSMRALLEALEDDPTRRRRIGGVVSGMLVLALGVAGGVRVQAAREQVREAEACEQRSSAVEDLWNEGARVKLRQDLAGTGALNAASLEGLIGSALDEFSGRWRSQRREACFADLRGEPDAPIAAACLDEELARLPALLEGLADLDGGSVQKLPSVAGHLARRSTCTDPVALARRARLLADADPEVVGDVYRRLARIDALLALERTDAAEAQSRELIEELGDGQRKVLLSEAQLALGTAMEREQRPDEAAAALESAYLLAVEAGDDEVASRAAVKLLIVEGHQRHDVERARLWAGIARASRLAQGRDPDTPDMLQGEGIMAGRSGDFHAAQAAFERAVELVEQEFGPDHPELTDALNNLAIAVEMNGDEARAAALYERSLSLLEAYYGERHPTLAPPLNNLGQLEEFQGKLDSAESRYERALAILEGSVGPRTLVVATTHQNLAYLRKARCELEPAIEHAAKARSIVRERLAGEHPDVVQAHYTLGSFLTVGRRHEEAIAELREAVRLAEAIEDYDPRRRARVHTTLGTALMEHGALAEARTELETGRDLLTELAGDEDPELSYAHLGLGRVALAEGEAKAGIELLERAIEVHGDADLDASHQALMELWLAVALPESSERRAELARTALEHLETVEVCFQVEADLARSILGE